MSELPVDQPMGGVLGPLPLPAGCSPLTAVADPAAAGVADRPRPEAADPLRGEDAEARFQALVAVARRRELACDRHGGLSRFDEEDDHNRGSLLYDAVAFQDTSRLAGGGWLDRVEAIDRLEARLAGLKAEAVTNFDDAVQGVSADLGNRHPGPGDRDAAAGERRWHGGELRSVSDELGLVLNLHRGAATRRVHSSWDLVHNFPATLHALTEGVLTERAAFTIVAELSVLDDLDDLRAAEAAVLDWAGKHPLQRIKQIARREAARRDPGATDKAHREARDERSVRMVSSDFGTADLIHTQDAVDAAAVMTSLSRAAVRRRRNGDSRTLDQLRADIALARLLPRTKHPTNVPGPAVAARPDVFDDDLAEDGSGADVTVVIHATGAELRALLEDHPATGGQVEGVGPIPQNSLRKHLIKAITDTLVPDLPATPTRRRRRPTFNHHPHPADASNHGPHPTDVSTDHSDPVETAPTGAGGSRVEVRVTDEAPAGDPDRYVPSAATDRYVRWRDRTCQFPGCNRPAEYTDLDHRVAFAAGGRTTTNNLHCLCRHHHRLKHEGNWQIHRHPDGTDTWTSPTGRRYRESPPDDEPDVV